MTLDDSASDPKAEPGGVDFLGGEEGLEDPRKVGIGDAVSRVGQADANSRASCIRGLPVDANTQNPAGVHRVQGVADETSQSLTYFRGVATQFRRIAVLTLDFDLFRLENRAVQREHRVNEVADIDGGR